jgi:hypothetical protein
MFRKKKEPTTMNSRKKMIAVPTLLLNVGPVFS